MGNISKLSAIHLILYTFFLIPFYLHAQDPPLPGDWVGDFYQSDDSYAYKITIHLDKSAAGYKGQVIFEWTDDQPHNITVGEDCLWNSATHTLTLTGDSIIASDSPDSINSRIKKIQFSGKLTPAVNAFTLSGKWSHSGATLQVPADYADLANCKSGQFSCNKDMNAAEIAAIKIPKDLAAWKADHPAADSAEIGERRKIIATSFFNQYIRMAGATLAFDSAKGNCTITISGCESFTIAVAVEDFRRFTKGYNDFSLDRNMVVDWDPAKSEGIVSCFRFTVKKTSVTRTNSWSYGSCN